MNLHFPCFSQKSRFSIKREDIFIINSKTNKNLIQLEFDALLDILIQKVHFQLSDFCSPWLLLCSYAVSPPRWRASQRQNRRSWHFVQSQELFVSYVRAELQSDCLTVK